MRALASLSFTMVAIFGCGPSVGDDPEDDEWMLGTFSRGNSLCADCRGGAQRYELSRDGMGQVVGVECEESSAAFSWALQEDGSVRFETHQDTRPTAIVLWPPVCDDEGLVSHSGQRIVRDSPESTYENTSEITLYRSSPCPGEYIPGDECQDDGGECDPRGHCTVVWCEGGEPERCDDP